MGIRRLLLIVVAFGALAVPAAAGDTRTLRVPDVKLSFAVPKAWRTVDARTVATEAGRQLRSENPQLAAILDTLAQPGSPVRLLAYDPATLGGFLTNVNVVVTRTQAGLAFADYLRLTKTELQQLPGLVGSPTVRAATLPAGRCVRTHLRASIVVGGKRIVADINQVAFLRSGRSVVVTFTSGVALAKKTAPVVSRAAASVRFG